jgi:hypothetical protein
MGLDESDPHWTASRTKAHKETAEIPLKTDFTRTSPFTLTPQDYPTSSCLQCR